MEKLTLKSLFESGKADLMELLQHLSLPRDAQKVQSIVKEHLNKLFDSDGEYRQHLTQSEDYILQAAMSLLNAQQAMASEFAAKSYVPAPTPKAEPKRNLEKTAGLRKEQYPIAIGGSAIGGAVGTAFGTWGAVFGAIAGTAVVLYAVSTLGRDNKANQLKPSSSIKRENISLIDVPKLNVNAFITILENICDSIDAIIETFRGQIKRVISKYESIEKPTIDKEYRFLIESIQSLLGYKRTHSEFDEKNIKKLNARIEDIAETLENYNLTVEDYTEEHDFWFEKVTSEKCIEKQMVYPAIVRNGSDIVLRGKIFIPKN